MTFQNGSSVSASHLPWVAKLRNVFHGLARRAGVDGAVGFAVLTRTWQMLAAPVSLVLIAQFMTGEMQGFYYTFASLLALQSFVELGLAAVVVNVASHEWAGLSLDASGRIEGPLEARSRLASLARLVFKWYAVASVMFMLVVGSAGYLFFAQADHAGVAWEAPWVATVVLAGLLLWLTPFISLLEGCNQVSAVNYFRMTQAVLGSAALWIVLALDGGLWAAVATLAINVLRGVSFLLIRYRRFFAPFFKVPDGHRMNWLTEIWPMQWRIAVSWVSGYFAFSLFNPVLFHYHGPVVAGQMGMTWTLAAGLQAFAMAWLQPKIPLFGMLIARKDYVTLDRVFFRSSATALFITALGAAVLWSAVAGLYMTGHSLAQRVLPPLPTGLFILAVVLMQLASCQSAYLRAHKREPLVAVSAVFGLTVGVLVWLLGSRAGALGAAIGYLSAVIFAVAWETAIWLRCRAEWHRA